jgi:hypothetical protein
MSDLLAYQTTRKDGLKLTLSTELSRDKMQVTGKWIEGFPVEVKQ